MNNKVSVFRREHFNSAHRLNNPAWDAATNARVFGKCNNPNYHGHNYELVVKLTGIPDEATGYVYDLKLLSDLIQQYVLERFDHKNLNLDCPEFKENFASTENFAWVIFDILKPQLPQNLKLGIILYETERNFVEICE